MTDTSKLEKWVVIRSNPHNLLAIPLSIFSELSAHIELVTAKTDYSHGSTTYNLSKEPLSLELLPIGTMETLGVKDRLIQSGEHTEDPP